MTNTELELYLKKSHNMLCCVDLAELTKSPDRIYQILNQHYKPAFEPNERIVFYSQYAPSKELISHIVEAALLIDISNFFILICCAEDIKNIVQDVCLTFGFADDIISTLQVPVVSAPLEQNFNLPYTFCPIPWSSVEVRANGNIFPCCMCVGEPVGNINNNGLQNTFINDKMRVLRSEFLQGIKPANCKTCWEREDKNLISNRIRHRNYILKDTLISGLTEPQIKNLDLKFGITCNFKCRICNSINSSSYAEEEAKFKNIPFTINKNWAEDPANLAEVEALLPTLTNIDMYGGEPFLLKSFSKILKLAVDQGYAKNIRLHYNTNGSVYPAALVEYWKHFRHIDIHFSIDNVGARFELERGGSWAAVEENILKIKNLKLPNCELNIMPAVSIMNIFYLGDVLEWAKQHEFGINPQHVTIPSGYALSQLTKQAKELIFNKYKNHWWPEMGKIIEYIKEAPDSNGAEFIKLTQHFDNLRNENFSKTHPEVASAMGYSV